MPIRPRYVKNPKKLFTGSCHAALVELNIALNKSSYNNPINEPEIRKVLKATFGSEAKGFGTIVALRNALHALEKELVNERLKW
jgi:hypothetical protein